MLARPRATPPEPVRERRRCADRGTGVFGTSFGFTVFLIFLLFTVQVLFGLYARTTITAVASDLVRSAADAGPTLDAAHMDSLAAQGRARLGAYGDGTEFTFALVDADLDGIDDTVTLHVEARLPVLLPIRWSGYSPVSFTRTVRARLETFQVAGR